MAIALDSADTGVNSSGSSVSFSHTCTGVNLYLVVFVTHPNSQTLNSVTYNSVSMTDLTGENGNSSDSRQTSIWGLANPTTGTNSVAVSLTGSDLVFAGGVSYTGVKQSGQADSHNSGFTSSGSGLTLSTTTVADNCWTVMAQYASGTSLSASTGSTLRVGINSSNSAIFDSNGAITPAGSHSMSTTTGGSNAINGVILSLSPALSSGNFFELF